MSMFYAEICAKRVELIKEAIPTVTRAAVLVNPSNPAHPIALAAMQGTAGALGMELMPIEARAREDIAPTIGAAAARRVSALVAIEDALFTSNARQIAEIALQNRLPMIGFRPQAEAGALLEYGVDLTDLFSRSAALVDKILRGTSPANLPIERAVKFEVIVNLKSANKLGVELPASLLVRANEVIE
jgi:putative ABC transport system substrate-binding protein